MSETRLREPRTDRHEDDQGHLSDQRKQYMRFGAMILTSMMLMYAVTYLNTYELGHVRWSEERLLMVLLMGATMSVVMLGFMLGMYRNWKINAAIVTAAVIVFAVGLLLVRTQTTIDDTDYMSSMIPHHSIAILTSENSEISDLRVCRLAVGIIEAQRREISEMDWLLRDIEMHGPAHSAAEAEQRPVPEFEGTSVRDCEDDAG